MNPMSKIIGLSLLQSKNTKILKEKQQCHALNNFVLNQFRYSKKAFCCKQT